MATTFPPGREADLLAWALNADLILKEDAAAYGLTPEQATAFTGRVTAFQALFNACNQPTTRTPEKVEQKKLAKKALITEARGLIAIIQAHPGTTDDMRRALDISIRDYEPTPVPVPETSPTLAVVAVMGRTVKVKLTAGPGEGRARPEGVKGATLYYAVGEDFPLEMTGWEFKGNTTLTTVDMTIPTSVPAGSKVWATAAWVNSKLQAGPVCSPVATFISNGIEQAA